jgi:allantoinase
MIIKGGQVALPEKGNFQAVDVRVDGGQISEIGCDLWGEKEVLDARGLLVLPGGIDPHVHFNDPGYTHREDFYHGSCAAASGGITTVIDMPCTSLPPVTNVDNLRRKLQVIEKKSILDFGLYGGVSARF